MLSIENSTKNPSPGARDTPALNGVLKVLGLSRVKVADDRVAIHDIVTKGLPNSSLITLLSISRLSKPQFSTAMRVSLRTLQRLSDRSKKLTLSAEVSTGLWQFAEIYARAIDVLGTEELADRWLQSPAIALNGRRPLELMATVQGAELVADTLDQLDRGVYL